MGDKEGVRAATAAKTKKKFWEKVEKSEGCWTWVGYKRNGYGFLALDRKHVAAHRLSLILAGQKLVPGRVVDHTCRNRACVRPDHLRQVAATINIFENSESIPAINKIKTRCKNGHDFTKENTIVSTRIERKCRTCMRQYQRGRYAEQQSREALASLRAVLDAEEK